MDDVITPNTPEPIDLDTQFLRGLVDDLAPFRAITPISDAEPGVFPWFEYGSDGSRLVSFAHRLGSYDWNGDPHRDQQEALLDRCNRGGPEDAVDEPFDVLW